jgi:AcrR family transcriptional regulator
MQVLKPEIRGAILTIAEREFYEAGYAGTPMRRIADRVGISVSNLYKYFADKDALFTAVVEPSVEQTRRDLATLFGREHGPADVAVGDMVTAQIVRLVAADRQRFVILMGRSQGSPYADFGDELTAAIAAHMKEDVDPDLLPDEFMLDVFAENFIRSILRIAERPGITEEIVRADAAALVRYHMAAIGQFIAP